MLNKCIAIKHERTKGSDEGLARSWVLDPGKVAKQEYVLEIEGKTNIVSRIFKLDGIDGYDKASGRTDLRLGEEILNSDLIGTVLTSFRSRNPIHYCKAEV